MLQTGEGIKMAAISVLTAVRTPNPTQQRVYYKHIINAATKNTVEDDSLLGYCAV
jgi:hypothetical protein